MFGITEKKKTGVELIEQVAGRFSDMIDDLESGADECRLEQNGVRLQIETLRGARQVS